ncbi:hypothetical protein [Streptomyces sp. MH60]|uniref:hypothetical protein n=1 Tax=Streptomyces sp. MH60 TaxID=1940758 RepID=UPI000CEDBF19|nr:hypothetical protein [Streptomyces sp. MH60]PPS89545.1 hypothetical protein BZZ08_01692 [Streptomyces sp. MH60]
MSENNTAPPLPAPETTPAMGALGQLAEIQNALKAIGEQITELTLDGSELALTERQATADVLRAQGRPMTYRSTLYLYLKERRGITVAAKGKRQRSIGDIVPQEVPKYLSPESLQAIRASLSATSWTISKLTEQREEEYPDLHARACSEIMGV